MSNVNGTTGPEGAIRAMFGDLAASYDRFNNWATGGMVHRWRRATAELAAPRAVARVLDLACGTGDLALHLAPRAEMVVGVDFCRPMLAQAAEKTRRLGLGRRVQFVLGNARALPFSDGSFDGITVGFGVRNLVDLPHCLAEMARVLRTGGRLAVLEIGRAEVGWARHVYRFYFERVVPRLGLWASGGQAPAFRYLTQSVADFVPPEELLRQLEAVGLGQVTYRGLHAGLIGMYYGIKRGGVS